jgi:LacI family transcriptional regulator
MEIARLAGVSRSTVSRVVNNYSNVPPETRDKVLRIIEQYNYVPNASAQVLARQKNANNRPVHDRSGSSLKRYAL